MTKLELEDTIEDLVSFIYENRSDYPEVKGQMSWDIIFRITKSVFIATRILQLTKSNDSGANRYTRKEQEDAFGLVKLNSNIALLILINYFEIDEEEAISWIPLSEGMNAVHECSMFPDLDTYNNCAFQ